MVRSGTRATLLCWRCPPPDSPRARNPCNIEESAVLAWADDDTHMHRLSVPWPYLQDCDATENAPVLANLQEAVWAGPSLSLDTVTRAYEGCSCLIRQGRFACKRKVGNQELVVQLLYQPANAAEQ